MSARGPRAGAGNTKADAAIPPAIMASLHASGFARERGWSANEFAQLLVDQNVFVCAAPDGTSGFALGRAAAGEAELLTLVVAPHARRAGLGRSLLDGFEDLAVARGAAQAFVEVSVRNAPAVALYLGAGYRELARRPGYYRLDDGERSDALVLGRLLGRP